MNYNYHKMSQKEILNVVECGKICVMGVCNDSIPYLIPVKYESYYRDNTLVIIIKSKGYGMKVRCISENEKIGLYFDKKNGCTFESVIAEGSAYINENKKENKEAEISIIINKISGRRYNLNKIYS